MPYIFFLKTTEKKQPQRTLPKNLPTTTNPDTVAVCYCVLVGMLDSKTF